MPPRGTISEKMAAKWVGKPKFLIPTKVIQALLQSFSKFHSKVSLSKITEKPAKSTNAPQQDGEAEGNCFPVALNTGQINHTVMAKG